MEHTKVTYFNTEVIRIKDNIISDKDLEAKHYTYVNPTLKTNHIEENGLFTVIIASQFECSTLPYVFETLSQFNFENFIVSEDSYELLEDYVLFAYRKHVKALRKELKYQVYVNRIRPELETRQFKNSLETILYFATIDLNQKLLLS